MTRHSALKNITLSANPLTIKRAREKAKEMNMSLNDAFRDWLEQFTRPTLTGQEFDAFMASLSNVNSGGKYSRDELNERR